MPLTPNVPEDSSTTADISEAAKATAPAEPSKLLSQDDPSAMAVDRDTPATEHSAAVSGEAPHAAPSAEDGPAAAPSSERRVAAAPRDMTRQVLTWMMLILIVAAIIILAVSIARDDRTGAPRVESEAGLSVTEDG